MSPSRVSSVSPSIALSTSSSGVTEAVTIPPHKALLNQSYTISIQSCFRNHSSIVQNMANNMFFLSDLQTGRSSSSVQVRLLRFWEASNVRRGGELMGVDMLLLASQHVYRLAC
ncbi:Uncharacterized protein Rs2_14458 [Raphanus sativus]|nr:Uncharacterized protein Rs2_14458 [Raphanus sativus]